jgi:hypothetical protein
LYTNGLGILISLGLTRTIGLNLKGQQKRLSKIIDLTPLFLSRGVIYFYTEIVARLGTLVFMGRNLPDFNAGTSVRGDAEYAIAEGGAVPYDSKFDGPGPETIKYEGMKP